jgi:hypothetical protein
VDRLLVGCAVSAMGTSETGAFSVETCMAACPRVMLACDRRTLTWRSGYVGALALGLVLSLGPIPLEPAGDTDAVAEPLASG